MKVKDFIKDYVYVEDMDDKLVPTWMFVGKIAAAENIDEACVGQTALDLGYHLFCIEGQNFCKDVVAAKEIKEEDIYDSYAQYLQGNAVVYQIK